VKLYDLYRSLSLSGLVWFEKLARYTRAYSRLLIPSASSETPSNKQQLTSRAAARIGCDVPHARSSSPSLVF
jgi:hypothetical protein